MVSFPFVNFRFSPTPGCKPSLFGGTEDAERGLNFQLAFCCEVK